MLNDYRLYGPEHPSRLRNQSDRRLSARERAALLDIAQGVPNKGDIPQIQYFWNRFGKSTTQREIQRLQGTDRGERGWHQGHKHAPVYNESYDTTRAPYDVLAVNRAMSYAAKERREGAELARNRHGIRNEVVYGSQSYRNALAFDRVRMIDGHVAHSGTNIPERAWMFGPRGTAAAGLEQAQVMHDGIKASVLGLERRIRPLRTRVPN